MRCFLSTRLLIVSLVSLASSLHAESGDRSSRESPRWLLPLPEVDADPVIPTLEDVLGYAWSEDITSPAEIARYVRALAEAAARAGGEA